MPVLLNRFAPLYLFGQALLALAALLDSDARFLNKTGEIVKIELYSQMSADLSKLDYIAEPTPSLPITRLMIAMSLSEMSLDDRMRLEQLRNERLRSFFAQNLLHCVLYRSRHETLIIHCPEAWIVDSLLTDLEELCDYAWLILGVEALALYFAQEEICRVGCYKIHSATRPCFQ